MFRYPSAICDRTDCVRAFTSDQIGEPLSLGVGGFFNGHMALRFNGRMYNQLSPDVPLVEQQFERTTWGVWKMLHPESLVFLGVMASSAAVSQN